MASQVKIPPAYTIYLQYLDKLKAFYEVLNNSQYQYKIMPSGVIFYKDVTAPKWIRIIPPKFISRKEAIAELLSDRQKLVDNAQNIQVSIFLQNPTEIKSSSVTEYNQLVKQIDKITAQIKDLQGYDIGDIEDYLLNLKSQRDGLTGILIIYWH